MPAKAAETKLLQLEEAQNKQPDEATAAAIKSTRTVRFNATVDAYVTGIFTVPMFPFGYSYAPVFLLSVLG